MTMPVTIPQIQAALDRDNASTVTVVPGTGNNTLTQLGNETLTVAAGKTLTLDPGIDMVVQSPGTVNVNGTMNINGDLVNNGTITVTSPNSLHVSGTFTNNGTVNNVQSGHIVPANGIQNSGTITTSGNAILESGTTGATVVMASSGASLNLNGGSISNNSTGSALRWENGNAPSANLNNNTDTTNIWSASGTPISAVVGGTELTGEALIPEGYKVVTGSDGQTSLRPTGGVEGGVIIHPVTVTFDANGGRWPGNAPTITVEQGSTMGAVSSAPTREGYRFLNWQDANQTVYTAETTMIVQDKEKMELCPISPVGLLVRGDQLYICDSFSRKLFVLQLGQTNGGA